MKWFSRRIQCYNSLIFIEKYSYGILCSVLSKPAFVIFHFQFFNNSFLNNSLNVRRAEKFTLNCPCFFYPKLSINRYKLLPIQCLNSLKKLIICSCLNSSNLNHYSFCRSKKNICPTNCQCISLESNSSVFNLNNIIS